MTREKSGKKVRVGEFELGEHSHDVGPELGRLYEAHNVCTGNRALVLMPGPESTWSLSGPLSVRLSYDAGRPRRPWLAYAPRGLLFLAFVGLGLALGYALRHLGCL